MKKKKKMIIRDILFLRSPKEKQHCDISISEHLAAPLAVFLLYFSLPPAVSPSQTACSASTLPTCAQTVTSVLLLVGSPLCLGCMCGEWP